MNYLKPFDFYYSPITLAFKGDYIYKTSFGGLLTILTSIILISFTFTFFLILINKSNFNIITSTSITSSASYNFTGFPFMFALFDENDIIEYDEKLFNIELISLSYQPKSNDSIFTFDTNILKIEKCHELQKKYKNFIPENRFNYLNFSEYLCIAPDQDLFLYGRYGDLVKGFRGIRFNINKCDNETLKIHNKNFSCFPDEVINEKLKTSKFIYHFLGYSINHYSNDNFLIKEEITGTKILSTTIVKGFFISFSLVNYYIDSSLITNSRKKYECFLPGESNMDVGINNYNFTRTEHITSNTIGFLSINMDNQLIEYHKKYQKLSEFLAELGGIINVILISTQLLNKYIANKIKIFDIMETLSKREASILQSPKETLFKFSSKKIISITNLQQFNLCKSFSQSNSNNQREFPLVDILRRKSRSPNLVNISSYNMLGGMKNVNKINENVKLNRRETKMIQKSRKKCRYYFCPVFCLKKMGGNIFYLYKSFTTYLCVEAAFDVFYFCSKIFNYMEKNRTSNIQFNKILSLKDDVFARSVKCINNKHFENII